MDFENTDHLVAAAQKLRAEYLKGAQTTPISESKFVAPKPTLDTSRDLLLALVDEANEHNVPYDRPESEPLDLRWIGFRGNVDRNTPEPSISEELKFQSLGAETKSPLTLLYVYGGTFVLNTPASYRSRVGRLAKSTGAKVLMVRQRLAPQNPFPAALLDVFQAYLALIVPPPGSPHKAIPPSSIVVTGDSSGANLALGLLQILLRLKKRGATITFHGQQIEPAIPSGMALLSPVVELVNVVPSFVKNAHCDMFPVPPEKLPYLEKSFPTCHIWPTHPARANLYCEAGLLAHPLASPAACTDWTGSCPLWFGSGQEQISDAQRILAQAAHKQGVSVTLHEYEKMLHAFFWYFGQAPQSRKILKDWADAIMSFVVL
ncbi:hypothetical protein N7512_005304 [Penicillium capsulatum]|nr:hypothetical protein N7512_005304 [Penicillium capsulatum]